MNNLSNVKLVTVIILYQIGVWNGDSSDDFLRSDGTRQVPNDGVNLTDRELFTFGESCEYFVLKVSLKSIVR